MRVKYLFSKLGLIALSGVILAGCGGFGSNSVSDTRFSKIEEVLSRVTAASERQSLRTQNSRRATRSRANFGIDSEDFIKTARRGMLLPPALSSRDGDGGGDGSTGGGDGGSTPPEPSLRDKYKVGDRIFEEIYQLHAIVDEWEIGENGAFLGEYVKRQAFRFFEDDTYSKLLFTSRGSTDQNADGSWTFTQTQEVTNPLPWMDFIRTSFSNTTNFETQTGRLSSEVEAKDYIFSSSGTYGAGLSRWEGAYTWKATGERVTWLTTYDSEAGTARSQYNDSTGYALDWTTNSDGSGSFTITNPNDPLTPATATFNAEGKGVIRFADGTEKEFDLYADSIFG